MQAILLDFDGPVFDARTSAFKALQRTLMARSLWREELYSVFQALPLLRSRAMLTSFLSASDLSLEYDESLYSDYWQLLQEEENSSGPTEITLRFLAEVESRGISIGLVSNRTPERLVDLLNRFGILSRFHVIEGSRSNEQQKPSPILIKRALEILRSPASKSIYIGDTESDYVAATKADIRYYHAGWTGEPIRPDALYSYRVLKQPDDLIELLEVFQYQRHPVQPRLTDDIRRAVNHHDISFYVGAGISVDAGFGAWHRCYSKIFRKLHSAYLLASSTLTEAAQLVASNPQTRSPLFDLIRNHFNSTMSPTPYHYCLIKSRAARIWTTNYDRLLETAAVKLGVDIKLVLNDDDLKENLYADRQILKMNGDFEHARYSDDLNWNVIFTDEQFDRMEDTRPEIWATFEDDYRRKCLVFVGSSFSDPALRRLITKARSRIARCKYRHLLLMKQSEDLFQARKMQLQAKSLAHSGIDTFFFSDHSEIQSFVGDIALCTLNPTICICGSAIKYDRPLDSYDTTIRLSRSTLTIGEIRSLMLTLGKSLATSCFRVISGGAPFIGMEASSAAFNVDQSLGLLVLRASSSRTVQRNVNVEIVNSTDYRTMRTQLLSLAHTCVFIGGRGGKESGVWNEFEMAIAKKLPVLLLPQFGGLVAEYWDEMMQHIREEFNSPPQRNTILSINNDLREISTTDLSNYFRTIFPSIISLAIKNHLFSSH